MHFYFVISISENLGVFEFCDFGKWVTVQHEIFATPKVRHFEF